jgi:hypothetical protein
MAANETPQGMKLSWTILQSDRPGDGKHFTPDRRGTAAAVGRKGRYEWTCRDGLHAAYHYPHGAETPVVLLAPQRSAARAYQACVDHNKTGL